MIPVLWRVVAHLHLQQLLSQLREKRCKCLVFKGSFSWWKNSISFILPYFLKAGRGEWNWVYFNVGGSSKSCTFLFSRMKDRNWSDFFKRCWYGKFKTLELFFSLQIIRLKLLSLIVLSTYWLNLTNHLLHVSVSVVCLVIRDPFSRVDVTDVSLFKDLTSICSSVSVPVCVESQDWKDFCGSETMTDVVFALCVCVLKC